MSLHIDTEQVAAVLLADGWHNVKDKSFGLDAYEYTDRGGSSLFSGGGSSMAPATGFTFIDVDGRRIYGPITAILAVSDTRSNQPAS